MATFQPKRWKINNAAFEFGIERKTLVKNLRSTSAEPGKDNCFSTAQICAAVYGDLEGERILKTREERKMLERENALGDREAIPAQAVESYWTVRTLEYRQRVMSANIPENIKKDLLEPWEPADINAYFKTSANPEEDTPDAKPPA